MKAVLGLATLALFLFGAGNAGAADFYKGKKIRADRFVLARGRQRHLLAAAGASYRQAHTGKPLHHRAEHAGSRRRPGGELPLQQGEARRHRHGADQLGGVELAGGGRQEPWRPVRLQQDAGHRRHHHRERPDLQPQGPFQIAGRHQEVRQAGQGGYQRQPVQRVRDRKHPREAARRGHCSSTSSAIPARASTALHSGRARWTSRAT